MSSWIRLIRSYTWPTKIIEHYIPVTSIMRVDVDQKTKQMTIETSCPHEIASWNRRNREFIIDPKYEPDEYNYILNLIKKRI